MAATSFGISFLKLISVRGMVCKDITCRKGLEWTESKTTKNCRHKAQHDAT